MLKVVAELQAGGSLYGFGLSETNLNRLEFNNEPIFWNFGYASHPKLFGLILYLGEFAEPEDIAANPDVVRDRCIPFLNEAYGVTTETLRIFPLSSRIMKELRGTPFGCFESYVAIAHPNDVQLFFSGRTEQELEQHFRDKGLITSQTKKSYKGFGKRDR